MEGFRPKPVKLAEYPGIAPAVVAALAGMGIVDSKALYEAAPDAKAAYEAVLRANEGGVLYKGKIGLRDMARLAILAKELA